ncbi:MAG: hypothetical protein ACTSRG_16125 [Candidatus Helarchaeota archaeon]
MMSSELPVLNKKFLSTYRQNIDIKLPDDKLFSLPEKVIQFGEGVFIRAFFNYFLEIANSKNIFNGRAVAVQPVRTHKKKLINAQNGLFTLCSRGLKKGKKQEKFQRISSISKAFAAKIDWNEIIKYAEDPKIDIIVSNTTEAGIVFDETDKVDLNPPISFPGKLVSFLYHRFEYFDASTDSGLLILPLELVENNGIVLKQIAKN